MMQQQKDFMITENDQVQVLELPYKGNRLSMVIILPREVKALPDLEKKINPAALDNWLSQMKPERVQVKLPKFKVTYGTVEVKPLRSDMGMSDAFGLRADFSGMTVRKELYISAVLHKAYVCVDEKGTEAAAATAVVLRTRIFRKISLFNADHPFLFLIRDKQTHSILFIGRMADPRSSE